MANIPTVPSNPNIVPNISGMYAAKLQAMVSLKRGQQIYDAQIAGQEKDWMKAQLVSMDKGLKRQQDEIEFVIEQRRKEREDQRDQHQTTLNTLNQNMQNALKNKNDMNVSHYQSLIKNYVGGMEPYFQKQFAPWLKQNAMGSIEYKDYLFTKNNPFPRFPDDLDPAKEPYAFGQLAWQQHDWKRARTAIRTDQKITDIPSASFLKPSEDLYLFRDDKTGSPYYMNEADMDIENLAQRWGMNKFDFLKNGGRIYGDTMESFNPATNRVERHRLVTEPLSNKQPMVERLPPAGQLSFDVRPTVNPFAGYNAQTQSTINGIQQKFGPYMQLTTDELENLEDVSPEATFIKEINRQLDKRGHLEKTDAFAEVSQSLSETLAPDLQVRLIEPDQFDKYTWYNPLDWIDPEHIKGLAAAKSEMIKTFEIGKKDAAGMALRPKYTGYDAPVGGWKTDITEFWNGGIYSPGPDFDIRIFRGEKTRFFKPDGSSVIFYYNNKDGADQVFSNTGMEIGTYEDVNRMVQSGQIDYLKGD